MSFLPLSLKIWNKFSKSKFLSLLLSRGKIGFSHIRLLNSWKHLGSQAFCGPRIHLGKKGILENQAR
jgi:hypothetical protein